MINLGGLYYENDISTKKQTKEKSTWIQGKNENKKWQKCFKSKKSKRQKKNYCINYKKMSDKIEKNSNDKKK